MFLGEGGALSDDDVRGLYAMADCLLFPSKAEGFGLPLVEAGMHRLPVFCSDLPVHREVIGERGGFFSPDAAPADIAAQIHSWFLASPEIHARRELWRHYDMIKICQERLEPLLRIA
jgi:glycosyltransferase involved in cell wall biosynthesis